MNARMSDLCLTGPARVCPCGPSAHPLAVPLLKTGDDCHRACGLKRKGRKKRLAAGGITKNLAEGAQVLGEGVLAAGAQGGASRWGGERPSEGGPSVSPQDGRMQSRGWCRALRFKAKTCPAEPEPRRGFKPTGKAPPSSASVHRCKPPESNDTYIQSPTAYHNVSPIRKLLMR